MAAVCPVVFNSDIFTFSFKSVRQSMIFIQLFGRQALVKIHLSINILVVGGNLLISSPAVVKLGLISEYIFFLNAFLNKLFYCGP